MREKGSEDEREREMGRGCYVTRDTQAGQGIYPTHPLQEIIRGESKRSKAKRERGESDRGRKRSYLSY